MSKIVKAIPGLAVILLFVSSPSFAGTEQNTSFTYQGQLSNNGVPANGSFDLQFALFTIPISGAQQGPTVILTNVSVANGIFTVQLDFGGNVFTSGTGQFLEIGVRPGGSAAGVLFTILAPRVPITPTPYAIRTISASTADTATIALTANTANSATTATTATNANQLGGVAANQYVQTNDSRLSDSRAPTAGNANYIQNGTSQQAGSNFNITGDGTVGGTLTGNVVNAGQYNISNSPFIRASGGALGSLSMGFGAGPGKLGTIYIGNGAGAVDTGDFSMFVGANAGGSNTTGSNNSFFGYKAGITNTTGGNNSFFGSSAGFFNNATGNAFFGAISGFANTSGSNNSFFGFASGSNNTTGAGNSFFGSSAGMSNTTGFSNSFFGNSAGTNNTGFANSFFGASAGMANTTAINNSFFGQAAGFKNTSGQDNTFIGNGAGLNNTTASDNTIVGSLAGESITTGANNSIFGFNAGSANVTGSNNTFIGTNAGPGASDLFQSAAIGAGATVSTSHTIVLGTSAETINIPGNFIVAGTLQFANLPAIGGGFSVCLTPANQISICASSLRYKKDLAPYVKGMDIINHLRPISFTWKDGGMRDLGFAAEEVAKIEPLMVTYNKQGQVEGVKYDRITAALVNALKEQQQQIESLKQLVCADHPGAEICK